VLRARTTQANGLEPVQKMVGRARSNPAGVLWRHAPDGLDAEAWLDLLAAGGMAASLLVACGLGYVPLLALCWILYLTIFLVGQTFLSFQWCAAACARCARCDAVQLAPSVGRARVACLLPAVALMRAPTGTYFYSRLGGLR
jgi:hypothetical protein